MGDQVSVQAADGRCGAAGSGVGEANLRSVRNSDHQGCGQQGSCAHSGLDAAEDGAERDHAADQGTDGDQTVRRVSNAESTILGSASLGAGVFLCDGRGNGLRSDQGVSGALF